tara:strand:+ start:1045 stop:1272 length:228 start_codon:yes stop_codon:yes gene_type:complete
MNNLEDQLNDITKNLINQTEEIGKFLNSGRVSVLNPLKGLVKDMSDQDVEELLSKAKKEGNPEALKMVKDLLNKR